MKKVEMKFSKTQLESIIRTLLEESHNKKFANNVRSLFRMFEDQKLALQVEIDVALYLIHKILELSIDYSLGTKEDILSNLNLEGRYKQDAYDVLERLNSMPIDRKIYEMSDKLVSDELQYGLLGNRVNQIQDYMTILQSSSYDDRQEFMKEVVSVFDKFNRDLKEASSSISDQIEDINLSDNTFVNFIGHVITEKRKPSAKIKLGVQYLNEIFNGGVEAGRVYLALGLAKGWKSGLLLNTAIWAKKYNRFDVPAGMKPVIVYLTMENTLTDTIERVWSHVHGNDSNIADFDPQDAVRRLEEYGIVGPPKEEGEAEIVFIHRSTKSIDTAGMRGILEDLEKEGKRPVLLVQDYLKRIRSVEPHKELRIELGNIANEFSTIAKEMNIPIVTAMQLNKMATVAATSYVNSL